MRRFLLFTAALFVLYYPNMLIKAATAATATTEDDPCVLWTSADADTDTEEEMMEEENDGYSGQAMRDGNEDHLQMVNNEDKKALQKEKEKKAEEVEAVEYSSREEGRDEEPRRSKTNEENVPAQAPEAAATAIHCHPLDPNNIYGTKASVEAIAAAQAKAEAEAEAANLSSESSRKREKEEENHSNYKKIQTNLGIARDGISVGSTAASGGFAIAQSSVDLGFGIAKFATSTSFRVASFFFPPVQIAGTCVDKVLDAAHTITKKSLDASSMITQTSLNASDAILSCTGAKKGEAYRRFISKDERMKDAFFGLIELLVEVKGSTNNLSPMQLIGSARTLSKLHAQQRKERVENRNRLIQFKLQDKNNSSRMCNGNNSDDDAEEESPPLQLPKTPHSSDLESLSRYMRYAAAAYGARSALFLGMASGPTTGPNNPDNDYMNIDENDNSNTELTDDEVIQKLTGFKPTDILSSYQDSEMYRPGHFVAINHDAKEVIVAIRGTLSLHDVLVDLVCHTEQFNLLLDNGGESNTNTTKSDDACDRNTNSSSKSGASDFEESFVIEGRAHAGFLKSAQRLANDLYPIVINALEKNPNYNLIIAGHSLGGGVATLLTLLWLKLPIFSNHFDKKVTHNIHAYAFAAPCSVSSSISQEGTMIRKHITSIVFGDDIVSRLGISTFWELQQTLVALGSFTTTTSANTDGDSTSISEKEQTPFPDYDTFEKKDEKLFCAGKTFWLESKEYCDYPIVEIDPLKELNKIELFPEMFAIHMPNACLDALYKLDNQ